MSEVAEKPASGQKLRVIQVVNVRWVNATAWYGLFLSRLLKEAGHEVLLLGLEGTDSFALAREWGLEPVALPLNTGNPLKLAVLYRELRKIVASFRPQVVNCHRGESFALWGLLKNAGPGAPFALIRTRGDQRPIRNNLVNRKLYAGMSDALIATNSIIARAMTDELGAAPGKVHTVLGGVDEKRFYPDPEAGREARIALGFGQGDFVVGLLGRLDPVKGHEVLIRALSLLRKKHPDAFNIKLLLVGAESSLGNADIQRMLAAAGLEDSCVITGRVSNVRAQINAMDLGVLASVSSEAIARAALEIMACGVPLLSSDVGVMPDLLPGSVLTPVGDAEALAEGIEGCWLRPEVLRELGRISAEAVSRLKSGDFLERTVEIYRACAGYLPNM